jgi:hypothetical protein
MKYQELLQAWQKFEGAQGKGLRPSPDGQLPSLKMVWQAIQSHQAAMDRKRDTFRGRAEAKFRQICGGINDHSNILQVFPKDDKYFCLFAGSLITIVTVCVFSVG